MAFSAHPTAADAETATPERSSIAGSARRERLVQKLFVRALVLFLALFLVDALIVGWLFFRDFDQRTIRAKLAEAAVSARTLAEDLSREIAPGGALDFVRIGSRRGELEALLRRYAPRLRMVQYIEILDPAGRLVMRPQVDDSGTWRLQLAGAFGGDAPPNPDTAPSARIRGGPWRLAPGAQAGVRMVQAPLASGAGTLLLGVDAGPLEDEVARLRHALVLRLFFGGAISAALLIVAFLFVLRLVHRTGRLEADAQRAEQLAYLGTLASGLAHEIRNPLHAMNINLQMLEEELSAGQLPEATVDLLRSSRGEVQRLERLVKDFLAFARPQTSRLEETAPAALVADVVRFVRPLFQDAGVQLELHQAPGAPVVRVDPGQIRQALLNILQNALEASATGDTVTVLVGATPHGDARVDVQDQGPGIPERLQPLVFQAFWSRKPAGSGLGLPIAQRAVEAHGGRIEMVSSEGAGSVFRIILPAAIAAPPEGPPIAEPRTES